MDTPLQPWIHDLATTTTYTDLWPLLLIVALLLWPLDIALRRVSVGRRQLAHPPRWLGGGGGRPGAPPPGRGPRQPPAPRPPGGAPARGANSPGRARGN